MASSAPPPGARQSSRLIELGERIDHKKIGIMYIILGLIMLLRGFADALMMRAHQAMAFGDSTGFLPPHHYDQIFTAHVQGV